MKKFIIMFIILVVLGGAAFIAGWIQIFIPADTYCVAFTKTGGFDKQVTEPGKFSWRWERLIPTNMTLFKFKLKPVQRDIELKGELPSAGIYSTVLPGQPDFTYNLNLSISFLLKPSVLPELVSKQNLRPDTIDQWYKTMANSAFHYISEQLLTLKDIKSYYSSDDIAAVLKTTVEKEFPSIQVSDISVNSMLLPDIELYNKAKTIYFSLADAHAESQKNIIKESEGDKVNQMVSENKEKRKIETFKEFGKLLNDYPILLKYFSLQKSYNGELKMPDIKLPETDNAQ
ncbi:MAG: hypothetical protein J7K04_15840 [Spirochaetales bacterium]|nr:hypothetical protein [Spirochaetales bacterium]